MNCERDPYLTLEKNNKVEELFIRKKTIVNLIAEARKMANESKENCIITLYGSSRKRVWQIKKIEGVTEELFG